ncbi:hypothetical protein [Serratia marcescens]|uniref:hypothetical protein n=1 Tax=Serratia marcescens TaxID=615 RepID=UPI00202AA01C|nr:hypothetical protein [Serratia marcescens]
MTIIEMIKNLALRNSVVASADVLAVFRELEAKDKRIAELERANKSQDDHINQQQDRIESLEKKNGDLGRSLGAAEKRLATPVRLSCETHPRCRTQHAKDVRAAGFTVEGDE